MEGGTRNLTKCGIVHALLPGYEISMQLNVNKIKNLIISSLILLFLFTLTGPASAIVVDNLYESEIPVADQTRRTRHQIFKQAFQQTIIRIVGNSAIIGNPVIDDARNNVLKYISQFRYHELPEELRASQPENPEPGTKPLTNILWIKFDSRAINNLLRSNQLPVWGKQRPETLVWIAVRDGGNRYILRDQDNSPIKDEIEKAAKLRGLPITWPTYDATDRAHMKFFDIWGGFWDNILSASRRYQQASVLVGRYLWAGTEWQVKWDLLSDRHLQYWQINSRELDLLSSVGVDQSADQISKQYALLLKGSEGGHFYIDIHGVNSTERYAKAMSYLQGLQSIKDLNVSEVNEQGVRFKIDAQGDVEDVKRMISLGQYLKPVNVQVTTQQPGQEDVVLAYELP